ncbi:MAG: PDDEXK nuclease domain-containing protein [Bacteroidia bacterium]|nr:PDDEXK nuclease domain-containing protein [Bacteroidia bacterium]
MLDKAYKDWLVELKGKIRSAQIKAAMAVNGELISLYWDLGKMIVEKQENSQWGAKLIDQIAKDLKSEFPDMAGFSRTNLFSMRQFFVFYLNALTQNLSMPFVHLPGVQITNTQTIHQAGGQLQTDSILLQIPWRHHVLIINKTTGFEEAIFYVKKTIENSWSRNVLQHQIESKLFERQGKAITNFKITLPEASSDLANQLLKDPYKFDFLTLTENYKERELENALVENITKFLLELGSGFAYVGKQVPMQVGDKEYYIDLLFYHLKLRAFVVIELKATDFIPEYAGKLSFYLSAANDILSYPGDNPTIGLLICKNKNNIIAEYSLKDINQPIGVTEYQLTKLFPEEFKSSLPTIEEIENELKDV